MTTQKIYYKKVRDLGGIFSGSFGFIKQNFKPLYGSLLFFAGPFILVSACISGYMLGSNLGMSKILRGGIGAFYADNIVAYFLTITISFIGIAVYNVILNKNLIENEKLQSPEPLTINHSIQKFFADFWRILGNIFLLAILVIISVIVIALAFAGLYALIGGGSGGTGAIIVTVLAVIILFVFFLIFGPILSFVPMATIFVCQRDRIPIFEGIRKVLYYLKGNFWNTWMISFVGILTYTIMAGIVQIPLAIISVITTFSNMKGGEGNSSGSDSTSIILVVATAISTLLSYGVMVIYHLIITYQYTSLEEKKEGVSILDKINQIQ
jgi:hypothetical protein